jgi:hypothetical protein
LISWSEQTKEAFSVTSEDGTTSIDQTQLVKYMDYARDAWTESVSQMRRSLLLALLLCLVFVLFQTRTLEKISIGPIEVAANSALVAFFPTLASYFFVEMSTKWKQALVKSDVFTACFRLWNASAWSRNFESHVSPDNPLFFAGGGRPVEAENATQFHRLYLVVVRTLFPLVLLLPLGFTLYAFYALFDTHGWTSWAVWMNAVVTSALMFFFVRLSLATTGLPEHAPRQRPATGHSRAEQPG